MNMAKALLSTLRSTVLQHKKKLMGVVIVVVGGYIARKKVKLHHLISLFLFCMRLFSKVLGYLPLPSFAPYRTTLPFKYYPHHSHPHLETIVSIEPIIKRIKNRQPGSVEELKTSVLVGITLNFILFNVQTIYDLLHDKYIADFSELHAEEAFASTIRSLKHSFKDSFPLLKDMLADKVYDCIASISTNDLMGLEDMEVLFGRIIRHVFEETEDSKSKVHQKKSPFQKSIHYQTALNYFTTTKEFAPPKKEYPSIFGWWRKITKALVPEVSKQLTQQHFYIHQMLYTLTIKKHRDWVEWPNTESKHLYEMVIQECYQLMLSTNFCVVSFRYAELQKQIFINRMRIYFEKKAKSPKKKVIQLLSVFYKIVQEELNHHTKKQDFYEREISNSLRDIQLQPKDSLEDIQNRIHILRQVYLSHQFQHLNKDFQLKYFNERDQVEIKPHKNHRNKFTEDQEDVQQVLTMFEKSKTQGKEEIKKNSLMKDLIG